MTPTKPNAVTIHAIFESTMTGNDGAEVLYCLPASCEIILVNLLRHPFPFQAATITSPRTEYNNSLTDKPRGGSQENRETTHPVTHNRMIPVPQELHIGRFQVLVRQLN